MKIRHSPLVETGARTMVPTLAVVSLYLVIVGHDAPGGGFVGGLLAGAALLVVYLSGGVTAVRGTLPFKPRSLIGSGLAVAVTTALGGMVLGEALLDAGKLTVELPWLGAISVGSAVLFDAGVYLVVVGITTTVLLSLGDVEEASS